jgi:hypothetical protein
MLFVEPNNDPVKAVARSEQSLGIVWFDNRWPEYEADDPRDWIENLKRMFEPKAAPWHFYVSQAGEVFEGLGWDRRSTWHELGPRNGDQPHFGSNSIAVFYLGTTLTAAGQQACHDVTQEHRTRFSRSFRQLAYSQVNLNSVGGKCLAGWLKAGGQAPEGGLADPIEIGDEVTPPDAAERLIEAENVLITTTVGTNVTMTAPEEDDEEDLSTWTVRELKTWLDEEEIDYPAKAKKPALIKIVEEALS